ncbi:MAG: small, acid-soluble spore protein, alpha/beta type [Muricoprocola sp.]
MYENKTEKKLDLENLTEDEKMKYEIAEELGLLDRVMKDGWKSLSAKETGRIGGMMTRRKRQKEPREQ